MDADLLSQLNSARRSRKPAVVVTDTTSGASRLVLEDTLDSDDPLAEELAGRFRSGASGLARTEGSGSTMLTVHLPSPRLVVIGAVHVSQTLAPMAQAAGFDVTVIDPRTAFASPERFGGVALEAVWPDEALAKRPLDRHTALAAITHDPKIDDGPLTAALKAGCFYVGALGSRKTHAKRVARLGEAGLSPDMIERVHAPIGLDIAAQTPAEIAVAILAEVIGTLRRRDIEPS